MYMRNVRKLNEILRKGPEQAKVRRIKENPLVEKIIQGLCENNRPKLCSINEKSEKEGEDKKEKDEKNNAEDDKAKNQKMLIWWPGMAGC